MINHPNRATMSVQLPFRVYANGRLIAAFQNPNYAEEFVTRQQPRCPGVTHEVRKIPWRPVSEKNRN